MPAGICFSNIRATNAPGVVQKPMRRPVRASSRLSAAKLLKRIIFTAPIVTAITASVATRALPATPTDISIEMRITPVPDMPPLMNPNAAPAPNSVMVENLNCALCKILRNGTLASKNVPRSRATQSALSSV